MSSQFLKVSEILDCSNSLSLANTFPFVLALMSWLWGNEKCSLHGARVKEAPGPEGLTPGVGGRNTLQHPGLAMPLCLWEELESAGKEGARSPGGVSSW